MAVLVNHRAIGLNISAYRYQLNLTQDELAERAGISKQFLGNIERGKGIPSLKTLLSLCDALNVTPNDLLRCSSSHDPHAPCTLRDEHTVFTHTLSDQFCKPEEAAEDLFISADDLPPFDIELMDIGEDGD